MDCPLAKNFEKDRRDHPDRSNPTNREIAFCFQFHDTVVNMWQMSKLNREAFKYALTQLEAQIQAYRTGDQND